MAKTEFKKVVATELALLLTTMIGLKVYDHYNDRLQEQTESQPSISPIGDRRRVARVPQIRKLSKTIRPSEQSLVFQDAITNLKKALRERPFTEGNVFSNSKVEAALRAFGPNMTLAIPTLVENIQNPSLGLDTQNCASLGLVFMGVQADEAIPSLIELFRSATQPQLVRRNALFSLGGIAEAGVASAAAISVTDLINLLNDGDVAIRVEAVRTLGKMGNYAKDAIPALEVILTLPLPVQPKTEDENDRQDNSEAVIAKNMKGSAAVALWKIDGRTNVATILAETIYPARWEDGQVWNDQLDVLGRLGSAAKAAIPNLKKMSSSPDRVIRGPALEALQRIDSEAANVVPIPEVQPSATNPPPYSREP